MVVHKQKSNKFVKKSFFFFEVTKVNRINKATRSNMTKGSRRFIFPAAVVNPSKVYIPTNPNPPSTKSKKSFTQICVRSLKLYLSAIDYKHKMSNYKSTLFIFIQRPNTFLYFGCFTSSK